MAASGELRVDLRTLVGRPVEDALARLGRHGIEADTRRHELPGPLALLRDLIPPPPVHEGDRVVLLTTGNRVVGFAPAGGPAAGIEARVRRLEERIAALEAAVGGAAREAKGARARRRAPRREEER